MRRALAAGAIGALAGLGIVVLAGGPGAAQTGFEQITAYDSDVTIEPAGTLLVRETIDYDFASTPKHGILREIPVRTSDSGKDGYDRVYPIDVVSVRGSPGTPDEYTTDEQGDDLVVKVGDPDRTITGQHRYEITYRVRGALNGFADHDELVWNAVGTEWTVPIAAASATVHAPGPIQAVRCAQGPLGSFLPCTTATADGSTASFAADRLGVFQGMTVSVAFPKGLVPPPRSVYDERFRLASAFRVTPATGSIAGGILVAGILATVGLVWWGGRDRRYRGSPVDAAFGSVDGIDERVPLIRHDETPVEFEPPDGLRPGQVGTLVDFVANPLDVTATIVDLAVRGYLSIEELEPEGLWHKREWKLAKRREPGDLLPYERTLMHALFHNREQVEVSALRYKFASDMVKIREELLDDAMARGWFRGKPGTRRGLFALLGILVAILGVAATVLLALDTHAGLLGVPVILVGIGMVFASRWMPRRTAQGYAVLRRADGFRRFIDESEKERARFAERKNLFSEYLPYAVVFGATDKWARAFAGLDDQPPDTSSWYLGRTALDYAVLSSAIDGFTVTSAGTLASSPPSSSSGASGFSGGGFSGGGGGGGGGGSW